MRQFVHCVSGFDLHLTRKPQALEYINLLTAGFACKLKSYRYSLTVGYATEMDGHRNQLTDDANSMQLR